ncbi:MAG: hypothetical protein IPL65_07545 [Lewinellaceae bacterium]|nr:hypothetical protein [Lewinellaceae bacterium]
MIHLLIYNSVYDYVTTAKLCEDAIAFFNKKDYHSGLPLQVFYYNLMVCYLQLKEFEKGQAMIGETLAMFEEGSFNWFKLQELFCLLAMHTRHYEEAYRIYEEVSNHPRYDAQLPQIHEMWAIFQAYLQYLVKIGKIELSEEQSGNFRLSRVLNDINIYTKDKSGMNISIVIIQILYSLAEKNYGQTSSRIDGTEKYLSRYLKAKDTVRSHSFIKMLIALPDAQYHREAVARKTQKYFTKLTDTPLEVANQTHEIEIIPYEHLWEMTIDQLDLKFINTRSS